MHEDRRFNQIPLDKLPVAMAYVPLQRWEELYDLSRGFACGTIFPSLSKPYTGNITFKGGCR